MKSDKKSYLEDTNKNNNTIRITNPLNSDSVQNAFSNKTEFHMPSLKIDTLITDANSFKEQFFETSLKKACSLILNSIDQIEKILEVSKLTDIEISDALKRSKELILRLSNERLSDKPFLETFTRLRMVSGGLDENISSIKKAISNKGLNRSNLLGFFEQISVNRTAFIKLHEAYDSLGMEISDLHLERQSFNGSFSDVFVRVITDKQIDLILNSMNEANNIILKLQGAVDVDWFKKELTNYQENMELGENDIRNSSINKPTLHLERLLDEEYERLRKFQEMISSVRTRGLYDKQLYTDLIKILSDNILSNQEEFLRIQKPFNVYKELYGFIVDKHSFMDQFNENVLSKAGNLVFDSVINARSIIKKTIELDSGDASTNEHMFEWINEYDRNDFRRKMANAGFSESFPLLKDIQNRVETIQSYITDILTNEPQIRNKEKLQELLDSLDERIKASSKMVESCEILEKHLRLFPENLLIINGKFHENLLRVLCKKQIDLILENLNKTEETVKQIAKFKGVNPRLNEIASSIIEFKHTVKEESKKGLVFEHFDEFQKQFEKIKRDISWELPSVGADQEHELRTVMNEIEASRDFHESIKTVREQIPDHEITEDTFEGIDWLEEVPFEGY